MSEESQNPPERMESGEDAAASEARPPDSEAGGDSALAQIEDVLPPSLHILPLSNRPFFPGQVMPLVVDSGLWRPTLELAVESQNKIIGLVLLKIRDTEKAGIKDYFSMGTVCRIHRVVEAEDKLHVMVEGLQRFRIEEWLTKQRPFVARPRYYPETRYENMDEVKPYVLAVINTIRELLPLNPLYSEEIKVFLERFGPDNPSYLADFAASMTTSSKEELQSVLESRHILKRLEKVLTLLHKELQTAQAQADIRRQVEEKMQKQQRDFFLREQLKAIQKELGLEKDDRTAELEQFAERLKKLKVPEHAQKVIDDETNKLKVLEHGSAEYTVSRNYLDWLTLLPWGKYSQDKLDIQRARKILDKDHEGLDDVKQRIVEFVGVGKMKGGIAGTILLLAGPPGVGKTSIGRSIANALGRRFFRFSVGGIRDEAEIKGHRRTYIGAMPGKFLQAMKEAGTANPVIMLDEIDKIGASYHGDPASALLEVLDPEQNVDFLDHYLDVRFDLSKVLFICTANQLDTIPAPLLDRMETIKLSGYLSSEKLRIAKKHLWPRQLDKAGLDKKKLIVNDAVLTRIIEDYAREAGVRTLEKRLGQITRKAAIKLLEGEPPPIKVAASHLSEYLGKAVFENEAPLAGIGVVTGLAWTPLGGATLDIEASKIHNYARGFKLTGQLGEVMRESAEIAYSYLASQAEHFGVAQNYFENAFIHLHVPAGATPKDGPSAGITMTSALLSLALGRPAAQGYAMTGEITLTGQVLPVGGIREKIIAARRVNIRKLILPHANKGDFEELPEYIREGLEAHFVRRYEDVAGLLF